MLTSCRFPLILGQFLLGPVLPISSLGPVLVGASSPHFSHVWGQFSLGPVLSIFLTFGAILSVFSHFLTFGAVLPIFVWGPVLLLFTQIWRQVVNLHLTPFIASAIVHILILTSGTEWDMWDSGTVTGETGGHRECTPRKLSPSRNRKSLDRITRGGEKLHYAGFEPSIRTNTT